MGGEPVMQAGSARAHLGIPASLLCRHPLPDSGSAHWQRQAFGPKVGRCRVRCQPGADAGLWTQTFRGVVMAQELLGTRRLVVGAHYGTIDFIVQRVTAVIMAIYTIVL